MVLSHLEWTPSRRDSIVTGWKYISEHSCPQGFNADLGWPLTSLFMRTLANVLILRARTHGTRVPHSCRKRRVSTSQRRRILYLQPTVPCSSTLYCWNRNMFQRSFIHSFTASWLHGFMAENNKRVIYRVSAHGIARVENEMKLSLISSFL